MRLGEAVIDLLARDLDRLEAVRLAQIVLAGEIGQARWWEGDTARAFDRSARLDAVGRDDVAAAWLIK